MNENAASRIFKTYGIYIAFAVLIIVISIAAPAFLQGQNIINIVRQSSMIGIIGFGMTFVIISGGIDLSVGSVLAFSGIIGCSLAQQDSTTPLAFAILAGIGVGAMFGFINGFLIARVRLAPFIVTLAMMSLIRGWCMVITDGRPVINISESYASIAGKIEVAGIPLPIIVFIGIIALYAFILYKTRFGRHVYAIGGNEQSAMVSGINVGFVKTMVYTIVGISSAVSGILLTSRVMTASPVLGEGYELNAIAAVVIGGTSLSGGVGGIWGTVVGVMIMGCINNGLDLMHVSSYYQQIIWGIIILIAVFLDRKKALT